MPGSPDITDLLRQLEAALLPTWAAGWGWRAKPSHSEYVRHVVASEDALAAISSAGDWRAIPSVLYVLAHENAALREAGAKTIAELAARIPVASLPGFEARLRESTLQAHSWNNLRVEQVTAQGWPPYVLAMFTMHASGYVREAALRRLVSPDHVGLALPYLLLRANDWVSQVQRIAAEAVRRLMATEDAGPWLPVLGLLEQLRRRSRVDHASLVEGVTSLFLRSESRSELVAASNSADQTVARWAFGAAMGLPEPERAEFIARAIESPDAVVRLRAAKAIRSCPDSPGRERLLMRIALDHSMPVRREALYARVSGVPEQRRAHLCAVLMDRHASMRHAARVYLRELSGPAGTPFDARAFYLDALATGDLRARATAIAGLGECGDKDDAQVVATHVAESRPSIAAAAVRSVASLDRERRMGWLVDRLWDGRVSVAREACRALESSGGSAPVEPLRHALHHAPHLHSRQFALRILLRRHPYDAVVDAVVAAGGDHPLLANAGFGFIRRLWPWSVSYGPSHTQREAVRLAIAGLPRTLPERVEKQLRAFMGRPPDV